jgi:hypothetical protein
MKKIMFLFVLLVSYLGVFAKQDDTVKVTLADKVPVIDGIMNDLAWDEANWQSIDQVWIPWGDYVDSSDYYGHYKILWSQETNLLYFLVEVHDDVWVDGFKFTGTNESYNYDIIEVFIDQDNSGGLHIFDGTPESGLGTNAENAFTYHLPINFPEEGVVNSDFMALDLDGTSWVNSITMNYANHFPEFVLRKNGDRYCWEFSLKVYNDTYDNNNPVASRVILKPNDIIGLSLAYCDNDDSNETPKLRDNFFGSVAVSKEHYNDHWMNSDDYGTIQLLGEVTSVKRTGQEDNINLNIYPNPSSGRIQYSLRNKQQGNLNLKVYNILGEQVLNFKNYKATNEVTNSVNINSLSNGIYILSLEIGGMITAKKFTVMNH